MIPSPNPLPVAVLDANILYSATLRDLFLRLTVERVFQPKWTMEIHEEWIRGTLRHHPKVTRDDLESIRATLDRYGWDWEVPPFAPLVETLILPDAGDRHILAAAIAAGAESVVTFNLGDFPARILKQYGINAEDPDQFALRLLNSRPDAFRRAVRRQREGMQDPPRTAGGYLTLLKRSRLVRTARQLSAFKDYI